MNVRSLEIGFEDVGPARSEELAASLKAWLNEAVVLPAAVEKGASPLEVEFGLANKDAQVVGTTLIISFLSNAASTVAPVVGDVAKIIVAHCLVEIFGKWWLTQGRPPMSVHDSETGSRVVITSDTAEPEKELTRHIYPGEDPVA